MAQTRLCQGYAGARAPVVGPSGSVVAQLNDSHDVQDPVDAPVPGPGQPVALLVAGGGVQRCGTVPRREVPPAGETVNVADIADEADGAGRADAVGVVQ